MSLKLYTYYALHFLKHLNEADVNPIQPTFSRDHVNDDF